MWFLPLGSPLKIGSGITDLVPISERSFSVRSQLLLILLGRSQEYSVDSGLHAWVVPPWSALRSLCLSFLKNSDSKWASPSLNALCGNFLSEVYRYFAGHGSAYSLVTFSDSWEIESPMVWAAKLST